MWRRSKVTRLFTSHLVLNTKFKRKHVAASRSNRLVDLYEERDSFDFYLCWYFCGISVLCLCLWVYLYAKYEFYFSFNETNLYSVFSTTFGCLETHQHLYMDHINNFFSWLVSSVCVRVEWTLSTPQCFWWTATSVMLKLYNDHNTPLNRCRCRQHHTHTHMRNYCTVESDIFPSSNDFVVVILFSLEFRAFQMEANLYRKRWQTIEISKFTKLIYFLYYICL